MSHSPSTAYPVGSATHNMLWVGRGYRAVRRRAETGTPPPVPAGGQVGQADDRHTTTRLRRPSSAERSCTLPSVREAGSSRGANARGSRHNI